MSYLKLYFGKEFNELTYEDIENYFKEDRDESNKIEYKSYADEFGKTDAHKEKINGILRTISGLLNSEGGLILWGAPKGKQDETEPKRKIFMGELSPVPMFIEKDSFINKVTDSITPSPHGIQFYPFKKDDSYVYIIEVEKSSYSPHQFKNGYFMRLDGQTVPAPHHYIEALFKKITYPRLEGYIKLKRVTNEQQNSRFVLTFEMYIFNQSKLQNEENVVCRIIIDKGVFMNFLLPAADNKYSNAGELNLDPAKSILFFGEVFYRSETILISYDAVQESLDVRLFFTFGGKSSPLMLSEYLISLKSIPFGLDDYNDMILLYNENQYLHEKSDKILLTEKEKLRKILGQ